MQAVEFNKHLFKKDGLYYVKASWLRYVKTVLLLNPNKFRYGVNILKTISKKSQRYQSRNLDVYYSITMNQFNHLKANLRGEKTYNYTTKN